MALSSFLGYIAQFNASVQGITLKLYSISGLQPHSPTHCLPIAVTQLSLHSESQNVLALQMSSVLNVHRVPLATVVLSHYKQLLIENKTLKTILWPGSTLRCAVWGIVLRAKVRQSLTGLMPPAAQVWTESDPYAHTFDFMTIQLPKFLNQEKADQRYAQNWDPRYPFRAAVPFSKTAHSFNMSKIWQTPKKTQNSQTPQKLTPAQSLFLSKDIGT